jgi:hypothetical protein
MKKLAAVFVIALAGAVALPTLDLSAQSAPSTSQRAKKPGRSCDRFDPGSTAYKDCVDRRAKSAEARRARQAACAQYKPKTAERRDCLAQQRRAQHGTTRSG